jgi:hypothetical protein
MNEQHAMGRSRGGLTTKIIALVGLTLNNIPFFADYHRMGAVSRI